MTQRWRKKLGDLDKAGPSDDVFTRAKEGPMHRDEAVVGPKMTTRVGTVVVAFAVFALAISVFAIPALRMGGGQAAAGGGLFPVWPAQSSDELQQLQADTNAGNTAWALNPKSVVEQFGQKVMGWSDAVVSEATVIGCTANFVSASWVYPTGVVMSGSPSSAGVSCVSVGYPPTASGYEGAGTTAGVMTGPSPDASGASIGGFRQYLISERGLVLGDGTVIPPPEVVVVYQPLKQGDGQIWAVLEARSPNIELPVGAGQTVHDGASISAGFNTNLEPTLGYTSCDQRAASSIFHSPGGAGKGIEMMVSFAASASCSGQLPGYVWAAASSQSLAGPDGSVLVDPLVGPPPQGLAGLTAEPIVAVFAESGAVQTATPTPTQSASDLPLGWTTYTDRLGWTVDVPPGWTTNQLVGGGAQFTGDGIVIDIGGGGTPGQSDDSSYPLDSKGFLFQGEGGLIGNFAGDGRPFGFVVMAEGTTLTFADMSPAQTAIVDRMISSIRFQSWQLGETRNGFTAVGKVLPAATAEWLTYKLSGDHYVSYYGGDGGRALLGPAPACPEGEGTYEIRETGEAGITCTNGSAATWKANWDFATGAPKAGNPTDFAPLAIHPAVLSWDGWLLAKLPQS